MSSLRGLGAVCLLSGWIAGVGGCGGGDGRPDAWREDCNGLAQCPIDAGLPACNANSECADPDRPICQDPGTPAAACVGCSLDDQCGAIDPATARCAPSGACVACLANTDCTASEMLPTCDATSHVCRGCAVTADCDSRICNDEDGSCIPFDNIYYVDDDAPCGSGDGSLATPFCDMTEGMAGFNSAPRAFLHVLAGTYLFPSVTTDFNPTYDGETDAVIVPPTPGGSCMSIIANATVLIRGFRLEDCGIGLAATGAGKIIVMLGTSFLTNQRAVQCSGATCELYGASIVGGEFGVRCEGGGECDVVSSMILNTTAQGLGAIAGSLLTVDGSTVTDSGLSGILSQNANLVVLRSTIDGSGTATVSPGIQCNGGTCAIQRTRVTGSSGAGISVADVSDFAIENTAVLENGTASAGVPLNGGIVLSPTTATATQLFAHNTIFANRAGPGEIAGVRCGMTTIANSIIWGNDGADVTFGGCYVIDSDVEDTAITGERNISMDPMFMSITPGAVDIHLTQLSPCVDAAPPMTGVVEDIDGDVRPATVGTNADMGADERP